MRFVILIACLTVVGCKGNASPPSDAPPKEQAEPNKNGPSSAKTESKDDAAKAKADTPPPKVDFARKEVDAASKKLLADPKMKLEATRRWVDHNGENLVGIYSSGVDWKRQSLYVRHYTVAEGEKKLVRELKELVECPYPIAELREASLRVTDLDKDNKGELTVGYVTDCLHQQKLPKYKLFVLEDGEKYAMRGDVPLKPSWRKQRTLPMSNPPKPDKELGSLPKFKLHLQSTWDDTIGITRDATGMGVVAELKSDKLYINDVAVSLPKDVQDSVCSKGGIRELKIEKYAIDVPAVYLRMETCSGNEDPPDAQLVYLVFNGKPVHALKRIYLDYNYGTTGLRFPGNGTIEYTEADWGACERSLNIKQPGLKIPDDGGFLLVREMTYDQTKGDFIYTGFRRSKKKYDCNELSACPFVYVQDGDGGEQYIGEILRNVVGKDAYTLQSLDLPAGSAQNGYVAIRLSEEKDEVTFLDEIYLEADGELIRPESCTDGEEAFCDADHKFHRMEKGDSIEFSFPVESADEIRVWARGYYDRVRR